MTLERQQELFDRLVPILENILLKKGNDYATQDRLSNFKLAGAICGVSPELNCLNLIGTKVARLGVLLHGKEPKNESIEDSIQDLINYAILLYMIRHDD